jgi:hypothetical protein
MVHLSIPTASDCAEKIYQLRAMPQHEVRALVLALARGEN